MKVSTVVIITKGVCEVVTGLCLGLVAGLAQWATGGDSPSRIAWTVIIASATLNGFKQLGSFLSTSFSNYLDTTAVEKGNPPPSAVAVQQQVAANVPDKSKEIV